MITAKSQLMNHSNLTINRAVLRPPYTQSIEALFGPRFPNWLISTSYKTGAINLAEDTWHRLLLPHPQSLLSCQGGNWVLLMWFILDIFLLTSTFLSFITEVLAKILFDYLFHDFFFPWNWSLARESVILWLPPLCLNEGLSLPGDRVAKAVCGGCYLWRVALGQCSFGLSKNLFSKRLRKPWKMLFLHCL